MSENREHAEPVPVEDRHALQADCANCFALCCVAPAFSASVDFAISKDAGQACPNLQPDFRCGVHTRLRPKGFRGCTVYDCFGAGQQVSQGTFGGQDWRRVPQAAKQMFTVFPVMRDLHELLWYLTEARSLCPTLPLREELTAQIEVTRNLTRSGPDELLELDVTAHRRNVNPLLLRTSERVRAGFLSEKKDHRGADLIGAKLKGRDLTGANLRGACLIGSDLRGADLAMADLTGADLRDADIRGAHLAESIFLIQSQVDAAKGDTSTMLPPSLARPGHWFTG
ncbi:pentapeptide repeat-containing protein [Nocardiopsis ansamitocini]|uniref:Pentapeptide repeat-containing protein n=1 Tax=Nocardiopsis ansamitocini TaxID=1670832 RepID=A0A9W6UJA0_9ACTN|nr:pentapeptide repeat-containing protein [Nocardiopsis ansamitocini]GLU48288.1 hypothetical protein Nans01_26390 [Nocardiopsis ansamitocini]